MEVYQACLDTNESFTVALDHPKTCERFKDILGVRCRAGQYTKKHDLTGFYDGIREEKQDGQFIPDVLLYNSRDESKKIYVEIAVTHFLSEEKAASGHRIIEIPVETEADIDKIKTRFLTERDARFVGFSRPAAPATDAECRCARHDFLCFMIFDSGKAFLDRAPLSEIIAKRKKFGDKVRYVRLLMNDPTPAQVRHLMDGDLDEDDGQPGGKDSQHPTQDTTSVILGLNVNQDSEPDDEGLGAYGHPYRPFAGHEPGTLFVALLEEARRRGFPVKNCYLCRYKGGNWGWTAETGVFCKIHKRTCNSNAAVTCSYFLPPKSPDAQPIPPTCSQDPISTTSSISSDQEAGRIAAKMREGLRLAAIEKERRETEERLGNLGARVEAERSEAARVETAWGETMFRNRNLSADLPDGCLYRMETMELWREPEGDYALYTKEGVIDRFSSAHAAFTYLSARGLLD